MNGVKKLLIASLVVNVIMIGVIGGHAANRQWHGKGPHKMMHAVIGSLPHEKQDAARAAYRKAMKENREGFKEEAVAREHYFDILRAKNFNESAFDEAGARLHMLRGAMISRMQDATKSIAKNLSHEERVELADALEHAMEQRTPHGGGKPPRHEGGSRGEHRPPAPPEDAN